MDSLLGILLVIAIVVVDSLQSRRRKKSQQNHLLPTEQPDPSAQQNAQPPRPHTQKGATASRLPSLEEAIELMKSNGWRLSKRRRMTMTRTIRRAPIPFRKKIRHRNARRKKSRLWKHRRGIRECRSKNPVAPRRWRMPDTIAPVIRCIKHPLPYAI